MSTTFEPIGIAVVGCGNISDQYLTNLVRFPDLTVVACADIDLARAAAQAAKYGVPHSADLATVLEMPNVGIDRESDNPCGPRQRGASGDSFRQACLWREAVRVIGRRGPDDYGSGG